MSLKKYVFLVYLGIIACNAGSSSSSSTSTITAVTTGLSEGQSYNLALYQSDFSTPDNTYTGVSANGSLAVFTNVSHGYSSVLISQQPSTQTCTISNAYLDYLDSNETINITCSDTAHQISVTVEGLASGSSFKMAFNEDFVLDITGNGTYSVDGNFAEGSTYVATFSQVPNNQYCSISAPTGTVTSDVALSVNCNLAHILYTDYDHSVTGSFGGREFADQACQDFITNNSLGYNCSGGVVAFLSTSATDEVRDFPVTENLQTDLAIYSQNPRTAVRMRTQSTYNKLADDWTDFLDGSWDTTADINFFWSGTIEDGSLSNSCQNWTQGSGSGQQTGYINAIGIVNDWSREATCGNTYFIGCLCLNDGTATIDDANTPDANYLFATTTDIAANFGDRTAADDICETTQTTSYSDLECTGGIHAFISYSTTDEVADFPTLYGVDETLPILDATNSNTQIADNWADLLDGTIDAALTVDWWSGTFIYSSGAGIASDFDCDDFSSTNALSDVTVGHSGETGDFWAGTSDGMCDEAYRLMCLCHQ